MNLQTGKRIALAILLSVVFAENGGTEPSASRAVMLRDIRRTAPGGDAALPPLRENQILPCAYASDTGYTVALRDLAGRPRLAWLPIRDEWGRASASAWTFDATLEPRTIRILVPVAPENGSVVFRTGHSYAVTSFDAETVSLRYAVGDFAGDFSLSRRDVKMESELAENDVLTRRERQLADELQRGRLSRERLQADIERTRSSAERIRNLERALLLADIETRRLQTEWSEMRHWTERALREKKSENDILAPLQTKMDTLLQQRAVWQARRRDAEREIEPMVHMQVALREIEATLGDARNAATLAHAELHGLKTALNEDRTSEQAAEPFHLATAEQAALVREIARLQSLRQSLAPWIEKHEATLRENQALKEREQALRQEVDALRQKIR
jgi:hypothetical protein